MVNTSNLLELIKKSGAVREFENKEIPQHLVDKIIEAGRWGLSVLGIQPWKLIIVKNKNIIEKMGKIMLATSQQISGGASLILRTTASTIKNAPMFIAIYNDKRIQQRIAKYNSQEFIKKAQCAEIQAIGGTIQNMFLMANALKLGCVWVDSPAFFPKKINNLLKETDELVAFLVLGYPVRKAVRSRRNTIGERIKTII